MYLVLHNRMRKILLKVLEECDEDIREAFLEKYTLKKIEGTFSGSTSLLPEESENWEWLQNPVEVALKWQQLRNYRQMNP